MLYIGGPYVGVPAISDCINLKKTLLQTKWLMCLQRLPTEL